MDLVVIDLSDLKGIAQRAKAAGFEVELREPDYLDPLGGVVDVWFEDQLVQVVNFRNSMNSMGGELQPLARDAIQQAKQFLPGSTTIRVVGVGHLIALKIAAWDERTESAKPVRDVKGLLAANEDALEEARAVCDRFGRTRGLNKKLKLFADAGDAF
ncbi:MAG TPA: hypothetical protein DEA08_16540 [Planctomycetes bacterium]|nr:hypothetical protein [Planctomycetota bacterium]